jgi:hypothetical protein
MSSRREFLLSRIQDMPRLKNLIHFTPKKLCTTNWYCLRKNIILVYASPVLMEVARILVLEIIDEEERKRP